MQRISRAPVLSATFSLVSFWITLLRPLQDLDQAPALGLGQRPRLDDAHAVALVGVVGRVVGVQRRGRAHDLLVAAVPARVLDAHGDRLDGLVGDDGADADLRAAGRRLVDGERRLVRLAGRGLALLALLDPAALALGGLALALGDAVGLALLGGARRALGRLGLLGGGALLGLGLG